MRPGRSQKVLCRSAMLARISAWLTQRRSMLDFSLCFQVVKGSALAFVFVRQRVESTWQKIALPAELGPKLIAMEKKGYRFNSTL